jgi:hypothetical protein
MGAESSDPAIDDLEDMPSCMLVGRSLHDVRIEGLIKYEEEKRTIQYDSGRERRGNNRIGNVKAPEC